MRVTLTGTIHDYYEYKDGLIDPEELREGDILVQSKLDTFGRIAVEGGNANYGYSGYFAGFLYADGGARRFLKWVNLWPIAENTFQAQQDKGQTLKDMQNTISRLAGSSMMKVKGGWRLEVDVNVILDRKPVA